MIVQVKLFATFRQGRFAEKEMELPDETSVAGLLEQLAIAEKDARILLVNGNAAPVDCKLAPRDVVAIFPPLGGG